jgi:hypothetical protein
VLGPRILPFLPDVVPKLLEDLEVIERSGFIPSHLTVEAEADSYRVAVLHFLTELYERIPTFMTSYVAKIIHIALQTATTMRTSDLVEGRDGLIQAVTGNVTPEVCVEAVAESWVLTTLDAKVRALRAPD